MDFLADYAFLIGAAVQVLAYVGLVVAALTRIGARWAVLALAAAMVSLVPTLWYAVAEVVLRFPGDDGPRGIELFYSSPAQLLMQALRTIGVLLFVVAVLVGRGPRKEAPVEGPTGTTFRQLPRDIEWK